MLCAVLYLENSDKARFSELKKRVENDYVLNKAEHPRTVTAVQILLLNYQPNYNSHRNSQSNRVSNQLMFSQRSKKWGRRRRQKREGADIQDKSGPHHLQKL